MKKIKKYIYLCGAVLLIFFVAVAGVLKKILKK